MSYDENRFLVDTMATKQLVVTSLTKDASIDECVFDLLDNAIDGARNTMNRSGQIALDRHGMPASYSGYWIRLTVSGTSISVADNCGGIKVPELRDLALKFGERSNHSFGIGTYGVGLNRAIFRLGREAKLVTDDGVRRSTLEIDHAAYLASPDWTLPATSRKSAGKAGTTVEIIRPTPAVAREFSSTRWLGDIKREIRRRYFAFLAKELEIEVNDEKLEPEYVHLREDGQYELKAKDYVEIDGVKVFMLSGQHIKYRLTKEAEFDRATNRSLTSEFGWNVICNDRAILISDRTGTTGWETTWHPEYNGFVGYVWFVSEDPEKLPWNTKKTGIHTDNKIYEEVLPGMRELASNWRTFNRKIRKAQIDESASGGPQEKTNSGSGSSKGESNTGSKTLAAAGKASARKDEASDRDHLKYTTLLPPDIDVHNVKDKLFRLASEAKTLDLRDHCYSGLLLLRALVEMAGVDYLNRRHRLGKMKEFLFDAIDTERRQRGVAPLTVVEKRNFAPTFEDLCSYFLQHGDVWGVQDFNYLKHSLERLKSKKKILNGVAHNPYRLVPLDEAIHIRDAAIPLIRHLLS